MCVIGQKLHCNIHVAIYIARRATYTLRARAHTRICVRVYIYAYPYVRTPVCSRDPAAVYFPLFFHHPQNGKVPSGTYNFAE